MEPLKKLKQTMIYMVEAHQQLLELSKQKRTSLIDGKVPELQLIINKESKFTELIRKLEQQREQLLDETLAEKGYMKDSFSMIEFIQMVDEPEEKQFLSKITGQLRDIVSELSELNQNNQALIQMALSYIQYSLNILMPKEPAIGYGMKQAAHSAKLLDAKI